MSAWGYVAVWLVGSVVGALVIGRLLGMAPDADSLGADEHERWGCDDCEQEAAEQAARLRHPSSRVTCPDYVPDWLS